MKRFLIPVALILSASVFAWAYDGRSSQRSDLVGRDIVDHGTSVRLEGTLSLRDGEWYAKTSSGEYAIHLGNWEVVYPEGIDLKDGATATITGFAVDRDVAAVRVLSNGKEYVFRQDDGTPVWAGRGQGRNRADARGGRI